MIANHFDYPDAVNFHNSKRRDCGTNHGLSLEETWRTTNWALRVFSLILALTKVNAFLEMRFFGGYSSTQLDSRERWHTRWSTMDWMSMGALTRSLTVEIEWEEKYHKLVTCPRGCKWIDGKWQKNLNLNISRWNAVTRTTVKECELSAPALLLSFGVRIITPNI